MSLWFGIHLFLKFKQLSTNPFNGLSVLFISSSPPTPNPGWMHFNHMLGQLYVKSQDRTRLWGQRRGKEVLLLHTTYKKMIIICENTCEMEFQVCMNSELTEHIHRTWSIKNFLKQSHWVCTLHHRLLES